MFFFAGIFSKATTLRNGNGNVWRSSSIVVFFFVYSKNLKLYSSKDFILQAKCMKYLLIFKSGRPDVFCKIGVLRNFAKFIGKLPWLITTSCLISQFQISGRKSETLGRGFKLSAEDLDMRPRILISGRGFESGFED